MRRRAALAIAGENLPVHTLGAGGSGTHVDSTVVGAHEEGDGVGAADELAVGGTVAVVVGADPVLFRVAVGALGDGAEEELFRSSELVGHADGEGRGGVAVDAIGSAAGGGRLARAYGYVRVCGCKVEDGGEADQE